MPINRIINKSNPIPLYIQLGNWLEKMIRTEKYKVGTMFPSEAELAKEAEVNRNTVRHAIDFLTQKGLVEKRRGVGTIVRRKSPLYPIHKLNTMTSFVDDFEIENVIIEDRILGKEKIQPDEGLAKKLSLSPGEPAIKIKRIRIADKIPLVHETQYYSFFKFGKLLEMNIKGSMYEILTKVFKADLDHSVQSIMAVTPPEDVAKSLGISLLTPCIFLESLAYTEENICIEVLHSYYRGDRYLFKVETGEYQRGIDSSE
ncbi:MAG: GntR family transcriptional regulator [Spirochaetota bacterium]